MREAVQFVRAYGPVSWLVRSGSYQGPLAMTYAIKEPSSGGGVGGAFVFLTDLFFDY